ncbi:MAG: hypothetical protein OEL20_09500 [Sulfuritalea sp.]|nr:hypothetical protein [Sulfuritalea sp.]
MDTDKLLSATESWFKTHSAKGCLAGVIERVKLFRKVVLNPYSHAAPPNIARAEVEGAISAVAQLLDVLDVGGMEGNPMQAAQTLIANGPPSPDNQYAALGFLRAAFFSSLRVFCSRKHVSIAFEEQAIDVQALWQAVLAAQAALFPAPNNALPVQINAERRWLILTVTETDLAAVTQADLVRLVGLLVPTGGTTLIFDTL